SKKGLRMPPCSKCRRDTSHLILQLSADSAGPNRRRTDLPTLIERPTRVQAAGNLPKIIDEYVGHLNTRQSGISVAHMRSPAGWEEPGQTPEFEEYTIVLRGRLRVRHKEGSFDVH